MVLGEVDEVLGPGVGLGETLEIAEQILDARDVDAAQAVGQPFAVMPLLLKQRDEALDGLGRAPRGNPGRDTAETAAVGVHTAADHHEVLRDRPFADAADAALAADVRDVLAAALLWET